MVRGCFAVVFWLVMLNANVAFGQRPGPLQPGKKFETELTEKMAYQQGHAKFLPNNFNLIQGDGYLIVVPVKLKAGQSFEITANVTGDGRKVHISLLDPTGKPTAASETQKSTQSLKMKNVSATGTYGVLVWSNQIGKFDVIAEFDEPEVLTLAEAKAKVERLKKELAAAEAELKALETKKPEPKKP